MARIGTHQAPATIERGPSISCCNRCRAGGGSQYATHECVNPATCPCHKQERIARLKEATGACAPTLTRTT